MITSKRYAAPNDAIVPDMTYLADMIEEQTAHNKSEQVSQNSKEKEIAKWERPRLHIIKGYYKKNCKVNNDGPVHAKLHRH